MAQHQDLKNAAGSHKGLEHGVKLSVTAAGIITSSEEGGLKCPLNSGCERSPVVGDRPGRDRLRAVRSLHPPRAAG